MCLHKLHLNTKYVFCIMLVYASFFFQTERYMSIIIMWREKYAQVIHRDAKKWRMNLSYVVNTLTSMSKDIYDLIFIISIILEIIEQIIKNLRLKNE